MNKRFNLKQIVETMKTIIIVMLIALPIGFFLGIQYQESKSDQQQKALTKIVRELKQNQWLMWRLLHLRVSHRNQ